MKDYYAQRAANYDQIYQLPERQDDLQDMEQRISELLSDRKVLEIACGTGYWTERFAPYATSVLATDINQAMLDVAQTKNFDGADVAFAIADAFNAPKGDFDAVFAGFWWSHVKKEEQADFLTKIRSKVAKDSLLVLIDNNYVEGSNTPIARTDKEGNTHQLRNCEDGSRVEILKNFPTDSFMRKRFATYARDIRIHRTEYYWILTCILR